MPRPPRPQYRLTLDALQQAYYTLLALTATAASLQEQLVNLTNSIAPIVRRDDGGAE